MALLELEGVVKHYRTAHGAGRAGEVVRAVDGVTLAVEPGELVALHGPSGSGKTTLLLLIAALLRPNAGEIRFDGQPLSRLSESQACDYLHRDVGFVHQAPQLMPRVSALENTALKLLLGGVGMREARARAQPWLQRVGLAAALQRTPEQLSAGERQRVALARALAAEPRLVLADEPTGNLDSARSLEIVRLLAAVAHERGAAVLLVTHDLEAAAVADRSLTLRDGTFVEHGREDSRASTHDGGAHDQGDPTDSDGRPRTATGETGVDVAAG